MIRVALESDSYIHTPSGAEDFRAQSQFSRSIPFEVTRRPIISPGDGLNATFNAGGLRVGDYDILIARENPYPYRPPESDITLNWGVYSRNGSVERLCTIPVGPLLDKLSDRTGKKLISAEDPRLSPRDPKTGKVYVGFTGVEENGTKREPWAVVAELNPDYTLANPHLMNGNLRPGKNLRFKTHPGEKKQEFEYREEGSENCHTLTTVIASPGSYSSPEEITRTCYPVKYWNAKKMGNTGLGIELPIDPTREASKVLEIYHGILSETAPGIEHIYAFGAGVQTRYLDGRTETILSDLALAIAPEVERVLLAKGVETARRIPHVLAIYSQYVRVAGKFVEAVSSIHDRMVIGIRWKKEHLRRAFADPNVIPAGF